METRANRVGFIMAPEATALEHSEIDNAEGFSVELKRVDDGDRSKRQDFDLECESVGNCDWCEAAFVDGNGSIWKRIGHFSIEKCNINVLTAVRERVLCWAGCVQNGLLGDVREGLEISGTSVVEMAADLLERNSERQSGRTASKTIQHL